jgi:hypothetical protein
MLVASPHKHAFGSAGRWPCMEDYETDAIKKTKDIPGLTFAMFEVPTHPNTDVKCLVCLVCIVYTIAITCHKQTAKITQTSAQFSSLQLYISIPSTNMLGGKYTMIFTCCVSSLIQQTVDRLKSHTL